MYAHVHLSSHSKIVELGGLLSIPALISVKNWVKVLAFSVWAMRFIALLWRAKV